MLIRFTQGYPEFFLAHLGGPYWQHKDAGAWSFPKGEQDLGEDDLSTAKREWEEETTLPPPKGMYVDLGSFSNRTKEVRCFAVLGDANAGASTGNSFEIEWPPNTGQMKTFYETDRTEWFDAETAKVKLHRYLIGCIDAALDHFIP